MRKVYILISLPVIILFISCNNQNKQEAEKTAKEFAESFYNMDYKKATELSTSQSSPLIYFIASNVTDNNIKMIKKTGKARATVLKSNINEKDSVGTVICQISNYLQIDYLKNENSVIINKQEHSFKLANIKGRWLVDLVR